MTARGYVLVVDDDCDLREAIADVLRLEGISVVVAGDGEEALSHLTSSDEKPALVLLDLMMPRMNGWELQQHMSGNPALASIPVCVVSASGGPAPRRARHFLHKPFEIQALLDVVATHLG
jgi:CheY-like chemotaxis protein